MYILGISAYYHDSAAVLLKDGEIVCAVEEERFSRIKHDNGFPFRAVEFCLKYGRVSIEEVDYVAYYEKTLLKFERILDTFIKTYPFSLIPFLKGIPEWIGDKIKVEYTIRKKLGFKKKVYFVPHHLSHAACAYYASPFTTASVFPSFRSSSTEAVVSDAAILTIDGVGEYQTTGLWRGKGKSILPLKSISFPHSLGLLYSTFTAYLGFKVNEDEYKLMGLAAYGKPSFVHNLHKIIKIKNDGSFRLDMRYFAFRESFSMWSHEFEKLLGKPRRPGEPIIQKHRDLAASIQQVTEEAYSKMLNYLSLLTGSINLCIGGGVALNALANGKIYRETPFKNVYVFGAAGDSGAALGAALFIHHQTSTASVEEERSDGKTEAVKRLYLGSQYTNREIEEVLKKYCSRISYTKFKSEKELINKTATFLFEGKVVGWFQGRMEFGPRALGSRSILAKPNPRSIKDRVNEIKLREQFRPFAGSILQERVHEYFDVPEKSHWSPFMTFCFNVKREKQKDLSAIVHADGTCRIQTVSGENGIYYKLIKKFYELTGVPCVLNTSYNLKGEPIVEHPSQAIEDFLRTKIDYLVIGDFFVVKI